MTRTVSWFSCGAASAVATKLAISSGEPVTIAYCEVAEEHPDNKRFLKDCEKWFGQDVTILKNEKYSGSIYEVIHGVKFIKGPMGAPCTKHLKKSVRKEFEKPTDRQVFGYTVEEQHRLDRFIDGNNDVDVWPILIENGLTKADCLGMLERAGIELPTMYKLGYRNNNCIGCVKGGIGYWNKIRKDFPNHFDRMSKTERIIGHAILKDQDGPIYLDELDPGRGKHQSEPDIDCGIFCLMAEGKYND